MFSLSDDAQSLEVTKSNLEHNHEVTPEIFSRLPRQRMVTGDMKEEVKEALSLKANSKLIQQKIQMETGKRITLKDISNLKAEVKKSLKSNSMEEIVPFLKKQTGATVEVAVDAERNFQCLFYQDQEMKDVFDKFPELILTDATYKLLDLNLPLFVLMVVDGHGLSQVAAIFIVSDETQVPVESAIKFFKKNNAAWEGTKVILSDKDFQERRLFSEEFPNADLQICLYHVFRTFRREITIEKMGITGGERDQCLEILQKIAYSTTEEEYEGHVKELEASAGLFLAVMEDDSRRMGSLLQGVFFQSWPKYEQQTRVFQ